MKKDREQLDEDAREVKEATILRNKQDKVRNRFLFLQDVEQRFFPAEYVRAQAKEACKILNELQLTPLNSLYTKMCTIMQDPNFMYDMYLMQNEFGMLVPDENRINKLIVPEKTEDE